MPVAGKSHAGSHDLVTRRQALHDLDHRIAPHADLHRHSARCAVHHLVDEELLALRNDRFFGHQQRVLPLADDHADADEHTRAQLAAGVVEPRADLQRTTVGVDLRVDRLDLPLPALAGQCIGDDLDRLVDVDPREVALRQTKVHLQHAHVLDIDEVGTVFDVIAEADAANSDRTIERRDDAHLRQARLRQLQSRLGHLRIRRRSFLRARTDEFAARQVLAALETGQRQIVFGLGLCDLGLVQRSVERNQQLTPAHDLRRP